METINSNATEPHGTYRVRDPFQILKTLITLLIIGSAMILIDRAILDNIHDGSFALKLTFAPKYVWQSSIAIAVNVVCILILFRLVAIWSGVKIDYQTGTLEFPGGSVEANDLIDYFRPSFIFQYFTRHSISLNQIRELSQSNKRKTQHTNGRTRVKERYAINVNGHFGAASVWFTNEGKRDEIYSAIRQLNKMGEPVFRA